MTSRLKTKWTWGVIALFVILTVLYFRDAIWSTPDTLLTKHLATDLYGHFVHVWERLELLKQGVLPLGDYWVQRGGGYPAASNDQLIIPQELLLMSLYAITNSFTIALKILVPLFYFATLITTYWYGLTILKGKTSTTNIRGASLILAVAFAFSMYGVNQLEHLELIGVAPLVLLTLIFFEKALASPRALYIILTSSFLFTVLLSQLYPLYFTLMYMSLRLLYQLRLPKRGTTLKSIAKVGVIFTLLSLPYTLPQLLSTPNQVIRDSLGQGLLHYSQPPGLLFFRDAPFTPYLTEIYFMYLGLSVLLLALLPTVIKRNIAPNLKSIYTFNLLVALFFILYSIGCYGPFDLATWFHDHAPLAYFIRVPGRALIIGYLSLAICTAIGFITLTTRLKLRNILPVALIIAVIIFADLTIGFEPPTKPMTLQHNSTYQFLADQPGDFRVIEISSVHDQQAMTCIYTGHDTLNATLWAYGHFEPLLAFTKLYTDHIGLKATAEETAFYGVKYITTNSDPQFSYIFSAAINAIAGPSIDQVLKTDEKLSQSNDYKLVHSSNYTNTYENLLYQEMSFLTAPSAVISTLRVDSNNITIEVYTPEPTHLIISQSYAEGWKATINGVQTTIHEVNSIQSLNIPIGNSHIVMHYQHYESSLLNYALFYLALIILIAGWLWQKRLWLLLPIYGVGLTVYTQTMYLQTFGEHYQLPVMYLGLTLIVGPLIYYITRGRITRRQ